jgi:hypothetical protein
LFPRYLFLKSIELKTKKIKDMDFFNFTGEDTGNFDVEDTNTDCASTDNLDTDGENWDNGTDTDALFPEDNYNWLDNYIYFGNQEADVLDMGTNEMSEYHHANDHQNHSSQISFTGNGVCTHKGCRCGGYDGRDSGNICMCTHSFFEHK